MASLIYDSFWDDLSRGAIDMDTDTFYVLLTTSSYSESKASHTKRNAVTNEITATGYTANGKVVACTVTKNTSTHQQTFQFASVNWTSFTGTARKAVYYKYRGGTASTEELVAVNDFGSDQTLTASTLTVAASTITLQN